MMDWLATEDGKKAVEAMTGMVAPPECGRDEPHFSNSCSACLRVERYEDAVARLTAALPHLDRLLRERYAAALEARAPHHISDGEAWYLNAAAFLRREPTL